MDQQERAEVADRVRPLLVERKQIHGMSWEDLADEIPTKISGQAIQNLCEAEPGSHTPNPSTAQALASWASGGGLSNIEPPTPAERERLADLLSRLAELLRGGYLPERVWAAGQDDDAERLRLTRATPEGPRSDEDEGGDP